MTSGTYIKISAGDYETDLQHGLQVCQKVEVMNGIIISRVPNFTKFYKKVCFFCGKYGVFILEK